MSVAGFLGTGKMVADFKQGGMMACARDKLKKLLVKTSKSWSAHALSTGWNFRTSFIIQDF